MSKGMVAFLLVCAAIVCVCMGGIIEQIRCSSACAKKCAPLESRFTPKDLCQCAEAQTWK